jgi:hypothetical protein
MMAERSINNRVFYPDLQGRNVLMPILHILTNSQIREGFLEKLSGLFALSSLGSINDFKMGT